MVIQDLDELVSKIQDLELKKTVAYDKPLDYISYEVYGKEQMFYIIAIYNNIVQTIRPDGRELNIPDFSSASLIHNNNSLFGVGGNQDNPELYGALFGGSKWS